VKKSELNRQIQNFSDEQVIAQYKQTNDPELIGMLFKRYTHLVFGVCMKYLKDQHASEDAVMEIFEKLFADLLQNEIVNFKSWLYSVSKNYCLMQLRKNKSTEKISLTWDDSYGQNFMELAGELHPNNKDTLEENYEKLLKALVELNEEQSQCIDLFYFKDKSYKEIELLTGYEQKQIKSYIQNGKRNLLNYFKVQDGRA
jgi:RNA polymerase sigma-70 factor (ECF subfamily)